jgi:hypothetical protein
MRVLKFILRAVLGLAIAATCSVASHADSSGDPRVVIKDAAPGQPVSGLNFGFSLPTTQGQYFTGGLDFTNTGSQTWTSLALFESAKSANLVSCGANAFFNRCTVSTDPRNPSLTEILFYNTVGCGHVGTGILAGENFTLDFSKGSGRHSWDAGTSFMGVATAAVPEPSTIAFLFIGMGAIATRRKLWKRAS